MLATARSLLADVEVTERHQKLCRLPGQGDMARYWEDTSPELWVRAVHGLPPETMKFALNASLNTIPTNVNLHMWGKTHQYLPPLPGVYRQSLAHILNYRLVALELQRYSKRHETVLQVIGDFILDPTCLLNSPSLFTPPQRPTVPPPHHTNQSEARHHVVHGVTSRGSYGSSS